MLSLARLRLTCERPLGERPHKPDTTRPSQVVGALALAYRGNFAPQPQPRPVSVRSSCSPCRPCALQLHKPTERASEREAESGRPTCSSRTQAPTCYATLLTWRGQTRRETLAEPQQAARSLHRACADTDWLADGHKGLTEAELEGH